MVPTGKGGRLCSISFSRSPSSQQPSLALHSCRSAPPGLDLSGSALCCSAATHTEHLLLDRSGEGPLSAQWPVGFRGPRRLRKTCGLQRPPLDAEIQCARECGTGVETLLPYCCTSRLILGSAHGYPVFTSLLRIIELTSNIPLIWSGLVQDIIAHIRIKPESLLFKVALNMWFPLPIPPSSLLQIL